MRHIRARGAPASIIVVATLTVIACGEDGPPPPALIQAASTLAQDGTVGQAVSSNPAVVVRDDAGNVLPGVRVAFGVTQGGGSIISETATTDIGGRASAGAWTLGTTPGENAVEASVGGLPPVRFTAAAAAGAAASIVIVQGNDQLALVGDAVPVLPTVLVEDGFGNPAEGTLVRFGVSAGGGTVGGANRVADAAGAAAPQEWRLGETAGANALAATVSGLPAVTFDAVGERRPASQAVAAEGAAQTGEVGQPVPVLPRVLVSDDFGNGVAGATVVFELASGGGSITGETAVTGADGTAELGGWMLGTEDGTQTLIATTDSVPGDTVTFHVATMAGPPAVITILAGDSQDAEVDTTVDIAPTVFVEDGFGNPSAGAEVTFTVTSGGGFVSSPVVIADQDGIAMVSSWRVGGAFGANTLEASAGIATPAVFTANGIPTVSEYDIEIRYFSTLTEGQQLAFAQARAKWRAAIVADIPALALNGANCAGSPPLTETVDDVLILAAVDAIDGPGGILGFAGWCHRRPVTGGLPVVGAMIFDEADIDDFGNLGLLDEIVVHEMGHVLGIGTLWNEFGLRDGPDADPFFTGALAIQAFLDVGGGAYTGDPVPIENMGGTGTIFAHWRESVFDHELMTGFINIGANPLSAVSIASLADMGYGIDPGAADPYLLPPPALSALRADAGGRIPIGEAPIPPDYVLPRMGPEDDGS